MDRFWEEFETGEIHFHDKWQFELTSEFSPLPNSSSSDYVQEFFIFIPNSLQINSQTYPKERFFQAQTNLIRFKTPEMTFQELLSPLNNHSPLTKLKQFSLNMKDEVTSGAVEWELKLYANIFQSTLAKDIYPLIIQIEKASSEKELADARHTVERLLEEIASVKKEFDKIKNDYFNLPTRQQVHYIFEYVEDTISIALNSSLTGLLKAVRMKHSLMFQQVDSKISTILLEEKKYREERLQEPSELDKDAVHNEGILYQSGLLNKYIIDALQLVIHLAII
jgi:hypothetical protein